MPSVNKTLGARFKIEGEEEYKRVLQNLNAGSRTLASEMVRLQAQYKGNTDSVEFLTSKSELLGRTLDQQREKTAAVRTMVEAASKAQAEAMKAVAEAENDTTEAQNKAKEALEAANREYQKYATQLNLAEAREFDLQHQIEETNQAIEGQGEEMLGLGDTVEKLADKLGIRIPEGAKSALNGMEGLSTGAVAAMTAAAAAIAAVVKVITDLGKLTLEVASQVDDYITESAITGVPTEMLQAWDYAAPLIDTDAETIKGAMTKITKAMGDAAGGSEDAQEKFAALGVSIVNESDGSLRSAEEVFYDVVDALGRMNEGAERDSLAMDLMGKSAQELNPLINAGSDALKAYGQEAMEAGFILDEYQIQRLGAVDDAYQKLQLTIEGNRKQLAADFAPAAKAAMELFTDVVQKAGEMLKRSGLIENLASIIESLVSILRTAGEILTGIPGFNSALDAVRVTLGAVAQFVALIADAADVVGGLFQVITGSGGGRMAGLERIGNAMGFGESSGNLSHYKTVYMQQNGTYDQYQEFHANLRGESTHEGLGYDTASGQYYDLKTGNYVYGYNAGGTENWRGGLTWVGESGPELVALPQGSNIYSNQESRGYSGDTIYVTIDAKNVQEFNDIVEMAKKARIMNRMR